MGLLCKKWIENGQLSNSTQYSSVIKLADGRLVISGGQNESIRSFIYDVDIENNGMFSLLVNMIERRLGYSIMQWSADSLTDLTH